MVRKNKAGLALGLILGLCTCSKEASEMIRIDGSLGEGGGQILRSALTLSLAPGSL